MKCFLATYVKQESGQKQETFVKVAAKSLKHAANKATSETKAKNAGELVKLELLDEVII